MKQELEEDVIEDPEQTCDECQRWGQVCAWPSRNRHKACLQCTAKCIKCMWDGESMHCDGPGLHPTKGIGQPCWKYWSQRVMMWWSRKCLRDPPMSSHCGGSCVHWSSWLESRQVFMKRWRG